MYIYVNVFIPAYICRGGYIGEYYRVLKGDTRSLDTGSSSGYLDLNIEGGQEGLGTYGGSRN